MMMSGRSDFPILNSASLRAVVDALRVEGAPPRIVGGAVRDSLLGLAVSDIDLATPLLPQDVIERLEAAGIKAVPTGIAHGTVTAVTQSDNFEITTLRRDVSTDGRHATVAFSTDWREDAARRDFTINALYADPDSGEIFDYFGGRADLASHTVRFIGDANARIAEDHLRILRYFRFHARFGNFAPEEAALVACAKAASSLKSLSRERIADELMKLLSLADPSPTLRLMHAHGIFAAFMPEVEGAGLQAVAQLVAREQRSGFLPSATRRLLAILAPDRGIVDHVAARLKLSNRLRSALAARLCLLSPESKGARALAYDVGIDAAIDIYLLFGRDDDWPAGLAALQDWQPPEFPLKGGALVARGLSAGPQIARTLQAIEKIWVAENFPDQARVNAIADQLVSERLSDRKE